MSSHKKSSSLWICRLSACGKGDGDLHAVKVPTDLNGELPELAGVLVLHQKGGGAQLLKVHLEGLIRNEVLGDLGGVLVDLICQLFWRRATVLAVVPTHSRSPARSIHSQSLTEAWSLQETAKRPVRLRWLSSRNS